MILIPLFRYFNRKIKREETPQHEEFTSGRYHMSVLFHSVAALLPIQKDAALGQRLVFLLPLIGGESARVFVYSQLNSLHCNLSGKVIKGINSIIFL